MHGSDALRRTVPDVVLVRGNSFMPSRPALLYALHSGNLYGTERMALATLEGLRDEFDPIVFAPPGAALEEAARRGIPGFAFRNPVQFARELRPWLARYEHVAFAATGVVHSALFIALNLFYRRKAQHMHLVHGGPNERDSYGRKKALNHTGVTFIAVSEYARERLLAHRVRPAQICVVENFLPQTQLDASPRRPAFAGSGVRNVVIVTRVDPSKRVDLVLDALDLAPELGSLRIRVLGGGAGDDLIGRAAAQHPNMTFDGFCDRVPEVLAQSDLLIHTCPSESFGLVILEAMAAGIPVLVPDQGGAAALVEPGVSGQRFRANDARSLAEAMNMLMQATPEALNQLVAAADRRLSARYSSRRGIAEYRALFQGKLPLSGSVPAQRPGDPEDFGRAA
jgi:glycosyltransferase involved in cell wall biosynthesis